MTQRTIKFRAQTVAGSGRIWVYGHFFQTHERPGRTESWIIEDNGERHLVYPETLGQFTGLHDKNGKEIWELNEIDGKYRVEYKAPSYVLTDISTGDILPLYDNTHEITREYSPVA